MSEANKLIARNKKAAQLRKLCAVFLLAGILMWVPAADAFESSSTSFGIHAGDMESVVGGGTSTSFTHRNAAGQTANGNSSSTSFQMFEGILNWLFNLFSANFKQIHYRWRNDDGTEVTATWAGAEDTALGSLDKLIPKRLRIEVSNKGGNQGSGQTFRLDFANIGGSTDCTTGTYNAVPTASTDHFQIIASANLTDGAATTNVASGLTDDNPVFVAGETKDTGNTTGSITLNTNNFTELEYSIQATSNAVVGNNYCFRVSNAGSTAGYTYTIYPRVAISSNLPVSGTLTSVVFDTTGIADGPAYNSITWKGNANGGTVRFELATSDSSSGPWTFIGGPTCGSGDWYSSTAPESVEITCNAANHNNKRYYRYKVQLCSLDCTNPNTTTPQIDDVIVNWSP
jgi:hypothetical protein